VIFLFFQIHVIMHLYKKSFLDTQTWKISELSEVLSFATQMKLDPLNTAWTNILKHKTFLMLFYNASFRTHLSFETAVQQLGGHAVYQTPKMTYAGINQYAGEAIRDVAAVMSRYVHGIGIRMMLDAIPHYGAAHQILEEYARVGSIPVINMCDDRFHPCQALADFLGWAEKWGNGRGHPDFKNLKGKKLVVTWAKSHLPRPWGSVQSHLLVASQFGMNVTIARPNGYDLDARVYQQIQQNCAENNTRFDIVDNPDDAYAGAHVVFVRNWISEQAYEDGLFQQKAEVQRALNFNDWITTTDEVADSSRSVMYDVAENRLHIQKALLALTMGSNLQLG